MSFLRPSQDFTTPNLGEEFYRAVVVDNNDPEKIHRVKIRIEELHGTEREIPNSNLPWAIHFRPSFLGGGSNLSSGAVPRVGSEVIVTHIRGEIYQPAYMFELAHNGTRLSQVEEDYPESYALRDSDGNFWHINMVEDKLDILFNGTQYLQITVDRNEIIGNDQTIDIGNNETRTIGTDKTESIGNNESNTIGNNKVENIGNNETNTIGNNSTENISNVKTINSTRLVVNTSADVDINASANVTINGSQIHLNGAGGGVLTTESINPITGLPFPNGSSTVKAADGAG